MQKIGKLFIMAILLTGIMNTAIVGKDKVLTGYNEKIQFDNLTPEYIETTTQKTMDDLDKKLSNIYSVPVEMRNYDNTVLAYDKAVDGLNTVWGTFYLMANSHPDDATRNAADKAIVTFAKYGNKISLDEDLYKSFKEYSKTVEAKLLIGYQEKFLRETVRDFERNGFALSKEKRDGLKEIQDRLAIISNEFSKNISEYKDFLIVTEEEIKGLDDDYKNARRENDGTYKIDLSYPSYRPFMRLSESNDARKRLQHKYLNRAADKNLVILEKLALNRKELAEHLNYNSYAEYIQETRMARNPETVWEFEQNLINKVREKGKLDYEEVLAIKKSHTGDDTAEEVYNWEYSYYSNILKKENYQVDNEEVKKYFELGNVVDGLFKITQALFGVEYKKVENPSVWQSDVTMYEVIDNGKIIGRFYLDLYPRDNKFGHAACFGIQNGMKTDEGYQIPTVALECNFPQPIDDVPALMSHSQVNTFFHEFGHVLHNMLTQTNLSSFSGTSVSRDFVEAPSQIFENWTWDYESLTMFAKHYETGEVLPKELFNKMVAAKNVGSGIATLNQIFYGLIDMTIHDKYNANEARTTTDIVKELQSSITFTPFTEGTNLQASFGHLNGYAASYYGYLWAKVYAQDMFSVFEEEGILNPEVGKRYREFILAQGANEEPMELVKKFLGRDPNAEAFYRSLGL
ncbi:MAG: Zn-dependent oligopeptidase [Melioribacteraceae bacterium]|jgi:thimet oligopeptidase|nr:Zn-dependent oligopeptidase [Melioribacteraceae bacterium]